jgi:hypothetical protein
MPLSGLGSGAGEVDDDLGSLLMDMGNNRQLRKVGGACLGEAGAKARCPAFLALWLNGAT